LLAFLGQKREVLTSDPLSFKRRGLWFQGNYSLYSPELCVSCLDPLAVRRRAGKNFFLNDLFVQIQRSSGEKTTGPHIGTDETL
jgi:hypothetical protein